MKSKILNLLKVGLLPALFIAPALQAAPVIAEQILFDSGLNGQTKNVNGSSVAIDGEWAFVGAPANAQNNGQNYCQVYVYKYDYITNLWGDGGGAVANPGAPTAGDPYTTLRTTGSCNTAGFGGFGASVSTSNGLLAVGAPLAKDGGSIRGGKIFFYQYDPTQIANGTGGWVSDPNFGFAQNVDGSSDFQANAAYGTVVSIRFNPAINKGILLGGAPLYDAGGNADAGKVYVYEYTGGATPGTGTVQFINSVEGTQAGAHFGQSVTSNGVHFLVGAPANDSNGNTDNGAGFLYGFVPVLGGAITQLQEVIPFPTDNQNAGVSVSLSPGAAVGNLTGSVMLLGGGPLATQHRYNGLVSPNGPYSPTPNSGKVSTLNGDVSQDGNTAGFGFQGDRVELYFDKQNIGGAPDWMFQRIEPQYGRDISVSGTRVMVNGNGNTTVGNGEGVAYAYYTASCYKGGDLNAFEWTMVGLQCDVSAAGAGGNPASIDEIFSAELGVFGDTGNWVMYKQAGNYEGHQPGYVIMAATETMIQGQGYWIISDTDKTWTIPTAIGDLATQTPVVADPRAGFFGRDNVAAVQFTDLQTMLAGITTPNADVKVMLSNPFPTAMDWSITLFQSTGPARTVSEIAPFFETSDNSAYVYKTGVGTQNGYLAIPANTPGMPREIAPGEGFFVRFSAAFKAGFLDANNPADLLFAQSK